MTIAAPGSLRGMLFIFCLLFLAVSVTGETAVFPICNEISFYHNVDDAGESRGRTLQIVSINAFHCLTDFSIEVTGDFNWDYDLYEKHDYYMELSLVKPVYKAISVNYQRIYGTFVPEPINQFGVRLSLFRQ
ncbi:MAG: hypothetical protein PHR28_03215 [candidate division Zixibacteria bacterium]|nr:hypothetical protein [candidate division Zixibacteria bacterium]